MSAKRRIGAGRSGRGERACTGAGTHNIEGRGPPASAYRHALLSNGAGEAVACYGYGGYVTGKTRTDLNPEPCTLNPNKH